MIHEYDYIIAGGGCAGLSLAYHILHSDLKDQRLLVIDKSLKLQNDKTWCFWTSKTLPYRSANQVSWREMMFSGLQGDITQPVSPLKYHCVNSLEFYKEITDVLDRHPNVDRLLADVLEIVDVGNGVMIDTSQGTFTGKWAFNSIVEKPHFLPQHIVLKQHFCGWIIETGEPTFNPEVIQLMDFQVEQQNEVRFMYVLPFSSQRALIEFTVFSEDTLPQQAYYKALNDYIHQKLELMDFWIDHEEFGVIPMTNYQFQKYSSEHIINIGTAGGHTKPSTGYTFLNIQEDAKEIVAALEKTGKPYYKPKNRQRFAFYDTLLLHIIQRDASNVRNIFSKLFKKNDFRKILKFLDEKTTILEELWILGRLPWKPFMKAIYEYYIKKSWRKRTNTKSLTKKDEEHIEYTV